MHENVTAVRRNTAEIAVKLFATICCLAGTASVASWVFIEQLPHYAMNPAAMMAFIALSLLVGIILGWLSLKAIGEIWNYRSDERTADADV